MTTDNSRADALTDHPRDVEECRDALQGVGMVPVFPELQYADEPAGWQFRDLVEGEWTKWRHASAAIRERYKDWPDIQFRPLYLRPVEQHEAAPADELIRKIAEKFCEYDAETRTYNILRYECDEDFFNCVRELRALPCVPHEAAPADTKRSALNPMARMASATELHAARRIAELSDCVDSWNKRHGNALVRLGGQYEAGWMDRAALTAHDDAPFEGTGNGEDERASIIEDCAKICDGVGAIEGGSNGMTGYMRGAQECASLIRASISRLGSIAPDDGRCYAPACGKWDGNDTCTCARVPRTEVAGVVPEKCAGCVKRCTNSPADCYAAPQPTSADAAAAPADERAAFEAWYLHDMPHETYLLKRSHQHPEMYDDDSVEDAWTGWQARAAASQPAAAAGQEAEPFGWAQPRGGDYFTRNKSSADRIGGLIPVYTAPPAQVATRQPEPRAEVTGWQPIETAPKDGTPLVMFARYVHATASIVVVASWLENYGMWVNQSFSCAPVQQVVPSHWMARPEFPIDAARAGEGQ
ncbi:hypothetical protein [Burkholderia metallica]|uniref:hypothetical protein n=1 Tax=Burkholderia metallica TaxID=488729 RepID=UPI001CF5EA88|nr:hypothetical protein [Burkholderia metallica]MCA8018116.1 hypothetical protein [Burkholderia metallica]